VLATLAITFAGSAVVFAGDIPGYPDSVLAYDPRETALLPGYCKYTQVFRERVKGGDNQVEIDHWYKVMGRTFHDMHHYCVGLMDTNRAVLLARNPRSKAFYLVSSISEFDYVIERAPPDFVLLPEIFTKKGENLIRLAKGPLGVIELERAIEAKPDYWPPYAALSDYYKSIGDRAKARDVLEKAIAITPDATALTRRLTELDVSKSKK
jgi:tetratricopeptide (TPR) repeat protein